MQGDQAFSTFHSNLSDIINSCFNLGQNILESKVVRKILRSLLERFGPKVTPIKESKDINSMRVDELVISLPDSQKPQKINFKASKYEGIESESFKLEG